VGSAGPKTPTSPRKATLRPRFALPSKEELDETHSLFVANEARDLFYRLSIWLMDQALTNDPPFSKTEALAVLLQTWNRGYYQRQRKRFDGAHLASIDRLLERHGETLEDFRARSIESVTDADATSVHALFSDFAVVLGPTGASKALHILAPRFFPLWDAAIARKGYGLYRRDAPDYWQLVRYTNEQVAAVGGQATIGQNPVKALDEFNYCRFTLGLR
jgi:hypothetical protein